MLCELSQHHICMAWADVDSKNITQLSYYEWRNPAEPGKVQDILHAEGVEKSALTRIVLSNGDANMLLIPASEFTEAGAKELYSHTFGVFADVFSFDELSAYNVMLTHALPEKTIDVFEKVQPVEMTHVLSCGLRASNNSDNRLTVHFTSREFYVTAVKEAQLKFARIYFYTTPLDVVYYLLSICQAFELSQLETQIILSGLISQDSAMYKELHQYFSTIFFWQPLGATLPSEHPPHFFSSMYNLAACVL